MEALWFCLVAIMIAAYVVLDGYDLGTGIVHFAVARNELERKIVLRSIGPVWDGNEVWLLAGGGTLYFAFPGLYAAGFSGFYLPLTMVLWLLVLRGISIEFRNHIDSPVWKPLWDAGFMFSSALLAIFFGAAIGNVVRGVPLDASRRFFLPLWTDFGVSGALGILDWYTVSVAVLVFLALLQHGALWVALKTEDEIQARARNIVRAVWFLVVGGSTLITVFSMSVQPQIQANLRAHHWGYIFPALAAAGLMAVLSRRSLTAFLGSCAYIVGMLTSATFGVFPYVLPARPDATFSLTIYNASTSPHGLKIGLAWWIPGMALALVYIFYTHRQFAGKVRLEDGGY